MKRSLLDSYWKHSKRKADLKAGESNAIEMEFGKHVTEVRIKKHKFEIHREGFWCPQIIIKEKNEVVALQNQVGFMGVKSQFVVDDKTYIAKTKQGASFNITYFDDSIEIVTYRLDSLKSKPRISFEIKSLEVEELNLLLLLALGFYCVRNVALEAMGHNFTTTLASY